MASIQRRRSQYILLFTIASLLALGFTIYNIKGVAFIFGSTSLVLLILTIKQSRQLYASRLICDNSIVRVSSARIIPLGSQDTREVNETVVSTFGLLIGSQLYKWGYEGACGIKLKSIEIDLDHIYLIFGDEGENLRVELLHGITRGQEVIEIKQKFWQETGIETIVNGW